KTMLPRAVTKLVTRGEERQLETARDAELVENPREVMLDGVFSDRKPLRDRAVRPARNHHGDDAELGPGQAELSGTPRRLRHQLAERIRKVCDRLVVDPVAAVHHGANAPEQKL